MLRTFGRTRDVLTGKKTWVVVTTDRGDSMTWSG